MKNIPILFSTPMVQAILEGRKTMTRRILKTQPKFNPNIIELDDCWGWCHKEKIEQNPDRFQIKQQFKCPYGQPGDILWVRETWCNTIDEDFPYAYKATHPWAENEEGSSPWKPSIHMPKEACRIFLKVKSVKVERLQDITEQDAIAEGIERCGNHGFKNYMTNIAMMCVNPAKRSFETLWQSINGEQSWDENPWVWVIEFEQTEKPNDFI